MKKQRRSSPILKLVQLYNGFLLFYLVLREIFSGGWWWLGLLNTFALWLFMPILILIPLALLLQGKRTAAISLFLALIGFWKFAPLADTSPSDAPHHLRVLTFNIWMYNEQIDKSVDWILEQDADIVILQEFIADHNSELPRLLEIYPFHITVIGNVKMLSRYPYVESEVLRIEQATDEHDGRLALRAVLDIDGQMITVYGVHLSLPRQENFHFGLETERWPLSFILRYDETRRNHQISNLRTRIAQEPYPVVLAGDFNTSHSSTILGELRAIGLVDSFDAIGGDWGMTWPYLGKLRPILRIDYIWASNSLRPLRLQRGGYIGSDHLPLVADFAFSDD